MLTVKKSEFIEKYILAISTAYLRRIDIDKEFAGVENIDIVLCIPLHHENDQFIFQFKYKLLNTLMNTFGDDINYVFHTIGITYREEKPTDDVLMSYANECWILIFNEQQTGEHEFPFALVED